MISSKSATLFVAIVTASFSQEHHAGELKTVSEPFRTYDGSSHPAETGRLWVRENREAITGRLIEIGFVRLKSTAANPRSPVVFLAGGPGIPGTVLGRVPVYYALFERLQASSDVILIDQRGIGTSSPDLQCPEGPPPAANVFVNEVSFRKTLAARVGACAEAWRAKGVDLAAYTTAASADDLDDLRRALGAKKLSIVAHSYGTTLALEAIRRHGEHMDTAVLAGVEGPDQALQSPMTFDFALRRISQMAASSPKLHGAFPDTYGEFQRLLGRVGREPLIVRVHNPKTKEPVDLTLGAFYLQFAIKNMLPNGRRADRVPAMVYALSQGDTSLLAPIAQDFYGSLMTAFTAMQYSVSCSDGASPGRRLMGEQDAARSVFGDAPFIHLDQSICTAAKAARPRMESMAPVWSTVRALFIEGNFDCNTPAYEAEKIRAGFPNGAQLIVENGFHETLPAQEVQQAIAEFLQDADTGRRVIEFEPIEFVTIDEAKRSQQGLR
jgi:pimeloyl-ACP methyl ester carboxylesterase